ncbi:hypothetical protein ACIQ6V_33290 [Streptomyces sp. NPDC096198]|uniref:hypothetical protein n=1 Tax=Streptomyces sp. NPDC096198 TaxID=3366080 RepID=UPI0038179340
MANESTPFRSTEIQSLILGIGSLSATARKRAHAVLQQSSVDYKVTLSGGLDRTLREFKGTAKNFLEYDAPAAITAVEAVRGPVSDITERIPHKPSGVPDEVAINLLKLHVTKCGNEADKLVAELKKTKADLLGKRDILQKELEDRFENLSGDGEGGEISALRAEIVAKKREVGSKLEEVFKEAQAAGVSVSSYISKGLNALVNTASGLATGNKDKDKDKPATGGATTPTTGGPPSATGGATTPTTGGATTPATGGATTSATGGPPSATGGATTPTTGGATTPATGGATTPATGRARALRLATSGAEDQPTAENGEDNFLEEALSGEEFDEPVSDDPGDFDPFADDGEEEVIIPVSNPGSGPATSEATVEPTYNEDQQKLQELEAAGELDKNPDAKPSTETKPPTGDGSKPTTPSGGTGTTTKPSTGGTKPSGSSNPVKIDVESLHLALTDLSSASDAYNRAEAAIQSYNDLQDELVTLYDDLAVKNDALAAVIAIKDQVEFFVLSIESLMNTATRLVRMWKVVGSYVSSAKPQVVLEVAKAARQEWLDIEAEVNKASDVMTGIVSPPLVPRPGR